MLKRTRTAIFDAWREYELVHGRGSAFWDTVHAALLTVVFWGALFALAKATGRM